MSNAWIVPRGHTRFAVEGVLDFETVVPLLAQTHSQFAGKKRLEIDLRGVRRANSAALALLLEWMELAAGCGVSLRFRNLPEPLRRLADLTHVTALLPVVDGGA